MPLARVLTIATLLLGVATALPGARAGYHLRLVKSEPADSATVTAPPTELRLWFSEDPALNVTRVVLTRGRDTLPTGALSRVAAKAPIVTKIPNALTPGNYVVGWRTMGRDGHVITGTFGFKVAPASPPGGAR